MRGVAGRTQWRLEHAEYKSLENGDSHASYLVLFPVKMVPGITDSHKVEEPSAVR